MRLGNTAKKLEPTREPTGPVAIPSHALVVVSKFRPLAALAQNFSLWHPTILLVVLMSFTFDRTVHFLWAAAFWCAGVLTLILVSKIAHWNKRLKSMVNQLTKISGVPRWHSLGMNLYVIFLGSWLPDIDWLFMSHRNPLTHSIIPFLLMLSIVRRYGAKFGNENWNWRLLFVFGYALSSHLLTDIPPGGNVVHIPAWLDMPFLAINGAATFIYALHLQNNHRAAMALKGGTP